jgi:site-specific recombinase XerD
VLGDDDAPVAPIESYLAFLSDIERSPNTVKAYAHDLKDWFVFLQARALDWREVRLEDVGEFVAWLRLPPQGRTGQVAVLPSVRARCTEATINRKLPALSAFYASWLLAGGADLQVVKERLGHASIATTEKYLHTLPDADETAIDAFNSIRYRKSSG